MEDKAEQRALEAYPKDIEEFVDVNGVKSVVDNNSWQRDIFLKGYHQAEKDLKLTWEDIELIYEISCDVFNEQDGYFYNVSKIWEEILKRFKERKGEVDYG